MELVWTKELSVGNASIDSDHQALIDMTNCIMREIGLANGGALSRETAVFGIGKGTRG